MAGLETSHNDLLDDKLDGLQSSESTESITDEAHKNLNKFPDDFADKARGDLQEVRAQTLEDVVDTKNTTKEKVGGIKSETIDSNLISVINEQFSGLDRDRLKLFESAIMEFSENNPDYQSKLTDLLSQPPFMFKPGESPQDYFKNPGMPTLSTLPTFNKKFSLIDDSIVEHDKIAKESIQKDISIISNILTKFKGEISNDIFLALEAGDISQLRGALGNGEEGSELYKIGSLLKKQGGGKYEQFKNSLISIDSDLVTSFETFEKNYEGPDLSKAIIDGLQPEHSKEDRNDGSLDIRTYRGQDGSETKIDTSEFPPKRTVSLEGSDYAMETETPMTKGIQEASTKYELKANELNPKIHTLTNLVDTIPSLDSTDVKSVKDYLLSMLSYTFKSKNPDVVQAIEGAGSISDLKGNTLMVLQGLKDKAEKELKDAEKQYKKTLADQVDSYREMMSEKDDKTKKILKTLKDTGFDILPQSVTDQLIAEMQSGQLIPQFERSFDVKNIDLANGDFGESETLENSDELFIQNIVRFMNKLAGLNPDGSNGDGVLVGLSEKSYEIGHAPKTPQEIIQLLKTSGVMLGNDNIDKKRARELLSENTRERFRKEKEGSKPEEKDVPEK